jgi:hypothetical protein
MAWYDGARVSVPYGNASYDVGMGGSHDMDLALPVDTPITALRAGTIVDLSSPAWGRQVGVALAQPVNNVPYMSYLHLDAINPALQMGQHVEAGDLIGWSGGENSVPAGASNPTNTHFTNPLTQSSQSQIGLSLQYGPKYGSGAGWVSNPEGHPELNPSVLLNGISPSSDMGSGGHVSPLISQLGSSGITSPISQSGQNCIGIPLGNNCIGVQSPTYTVNWQDLLYRGGFILVGLLLIFLGLKHFLGPSMNITVQEPEPGRGEA